MISPGARNPGKASAEIRRNFNAADRASAEAKLTECVNTHVRSAPNLAIWTKQSIPEGLTVFSPRKQKTTTEPTVIL